MFVIFECANLFLIISSCKTQPINAFCLIVSISKIGFGVGFFRPVACLDDFRSDFRYCLEHFATCREEDEDDVDELLDSELLSSSEFEFRLCERFFLQDRRDLRTLPELELLLLLLSDSLESESELSELLLLLSELELGEDCLLQIVFIMSSNFSFFCLMLFANLFKILR